MTTASTKPTKVEDFFADGEAFEDALLQAEDHDLRGASADFVSDLRKAWEAYGCRMNLSQAQYRWLCRLIGEDCSE